MPARVILLCALVVLVPFSYAAFDGDDEGESEETSTSTSSRPYYDDDEIVSLVFEHSLLTTKNLVYSPLKDKADELVYNSFVPRFKLEFKRPSQPSSGLGPQISLSKMRMSHVFDWTPEHVQNFRDLVAENGIYRIRVPVKFKHSSDDHEDRESSSVPHHVMTSIRACALVASNFAEHFTLVVDSSNNIHSLRYDVPAKSCPANLKVNGTIRFSPVFRVAYPPEGIRPILPVPNAGGGGGGGGGGSAPANSDGKPTQPGQPQEQQSFFRKYWYFIVPIGLILLSNAIQPDTAPPANRRPGAAGGAAASGSAASGARGAASGSAAAGAGPRLKRPPPR
eukprot:CAMPEP_0184343032 /NCGR_PEP_ID=MMETSP1089-20130417/11588_1 /TAXON_ID=38269 ORGANISM="Gloeochaete wittrockiana, Strain SAG46.84" /NCGR_SAMPLE_ID=MMETSP1089 /ASSEMBLY_ACC=CAM_ASM_000445 /LENGTH=336 /DNA_ID=CAMNT_0026672155 /DNA_START=28 /DNA_END=1038 /DNA_ORIENTATION=-